MKDKPIIIALDFDSEDAALVLLDQLDPALCRVKIGKELFTSCGPQLLRRLESMGFDVFLDLKFHDIPNTVAGACRAAAELGVWMLNIHAVGGLAMMEAARQAVDEAGDERPLLIAVTVLTSMGSEDLVAVGIEREPEQQVLLLAQLAERARLDGVVCSARETSMLRCELPAKFCLVTPGIRRPVDAGDDQKRVVGPREAIAQGSDYLVVGRPITRAADPAAALAEFNSLVAGET